VTIQCLYCKGFGHIKPNCPKNSSKFKSDIRVGFYFDDTTPRELLTSGTVNGSWVSTILRATGWSCIIVSEEVLPDVDVSLCKKVKVFDYLGRLNIFPQVRCYLKCLFYDGWVNALRAAIKFCSDLVGNYPGVRNVNIQRKIVPDQISQVTETISSRVKCVHRLVLP